MLLNTASVDGATTSSVKFNSNLFSSYVPESCVDGPTPITIVSFKDLERLRNYQPSPVKQMFCRKGSEMAYLYPEIQSKH